MTISTSAEGTSSTGVYFHHYPPQQILHNIAEPQWLAPPVHQSTTATNESNLDRIERDEEAYLEQLRASSLAYRAPPPSSETGGSGNSSDHNQHQHSGCYPVVGVSPSSKLMSDILLQFHQEAETIDLLGMNAIQDTDSNSAGGAENNSSASFFNKHQSKFQELFLRHQRQHRTGDHESSIHASTSVKNAALSSNGPIQVESTATKHSEIEDASHSSSMMMMSMNSSTTTLMSP